MKTPKTAHATPAKAKAQFQRLLELAGVDSGSALARLLGNVTPSGVLYWAKVGLSPAKAQELQDAHGWNAQYILHGTGEPPASEQTPDAPPRVKKTRKARTPIHEVVYPSEPPASVPVQFNGVTAMYLAIAQPMKFVLADAGAVSIEHKDGQTLVHVSPR